MVPVLGLVPKSAADFYFLALSDPLCRAIALAHSRGIPPGRYRTVRGLRQVAHTILAHSPPPKDAGNGRLPPCARADGWWAGIGLSWWNPIPADECNVCMPVGPNGVRAYMTLHASVTGGP